MLQSTMSYITKDWVTARLPKRPKDANKGTFGKVMVIAGSENYPGAAYLSCAGAYRVGAGLVTLATEPNVKTIVSRKLPEVTFILFSEVFEKLAEYNVILLGPGLGQAEEIQEFIRQFIILKILPKLVIDGDGLNILSKMDKWWEKLKTEVVLTPHPGEMVRLTNLSVEHIQKDRENIAKEYAAEWDQVVVLKGANTVVVSPTSEVKVSPFANPALATAGTGDILSGIIAGFIAQGLNNFDAACCAVYIHGLAGEILREKIGETGLLASELLPNLPLVIRKLKQT